MTYKPTERMERIERHLPESARFYLEEARISQNTRRALESYIGALDIVDPQSRGTKSAKAIIDEFYERKIPGDAALQAGPWQVDVAREFKNYDGALIISKDPLSDSGCYRPDPSDYKRIELMIATYLIPRMNDGTKKDREDKRMLSSILTLLSIEKPSRRNDDFDF